MDKIGQQLKAYRQQHDLSLEDVAFMLNIPLPDYADLENGAAELPLKLLVKLCRLYKINPDDLLRQGERETPKPNLEAPPKTKPTVALALPKAASSEPEEPTDTSDAWRFDWDKAPKKLTPKQAVAILKKHGTLVTEEEAEKVLEFMHTMSGLALDYYMEEAKWKEKLQEFPDGYVFDTTGHGCRICGHSATGGWYDRFGLKCALCQQAVNKGIIPGEITGDKSLYYTEYEIGKFFNLEGKMLMHWIRQGVIKARIITGENGKSKHLRMFLLEDNAGFLPPKEMLECHEYIEVEKTAKYGKSGCNGTSVKIRLNT
jgi:transcriptional regulator with XRE-family HTH domain